MESVVGKDTAGHFLILADNIVPKKETSPPNIYQLTLERLEVAPDEALMIEDSRDGPEAAVAAGVCRVVTLSIYIERRYARSSAGVSDLGEPDASMQVVNAARPGWEIT